MRYVIAGAIILLFFCKIIGFRVANALTSLAFYGIIFYLSFPIFWIWLFMTTR